VKAGKFKPSPVVLKKEGYMTRPLRVDERLLPKKLKLVKHHKHTPRNGEMALSLPQSSGYGVYINANLARFLRGRDIKYVEVYTDPSVEAVALSPTEDMREGYVLSDTGERGTHITAKLRTVMPHGRYVYQHDESTKDVFVFKREQISFKGKKVKNV
jgi:hypothetical protein